ncbi:hypothetical protein SAMN04489735_10346 [Aneurinibacillus thermoaerophilus]|uniref:Uncharacterized protein n=1 Tax=Aneurinibacillus thermoaerophilus TaxID=143495 RepID=A0A1G8DK69_ANETH|nr:MULTISPECIES: hypothetical protein [Aneurinibacillus]SDH58042.1 hypothetical protein SAMN04489735_10346 [Aneurinibacillus thermoaerophilus]
MLSVSFLLCSAYSKKKGGKHDGVWSVAAITAAVYVILAWVLVWGGRFLFDRFPPHLQRTGRKSGSLQVVLLLDNPDEHLEYAVRHALWVSAAHGVSLQIYVNEEVNSSTLLPMIQRAWPDLPIRNIKPQEPLLPLHTWFLDFPH